jgi:hypothetical protein
MHLIVELLLFLFRLALVPLTDLDHKIVDWWREQISNGWNTIEAKVHKVDIWEERLWYAEVSYSYSVANEFYSGFARWHFAREKDAEAFAVRFPRESSITIRFDPDQPETSLLRTSDQPSWVYSSV